MVWNGWSRAGCNSSSLRWTFESILGESLVYAVVMYDCNYTNQKIMLSDKLLLFDDIVASDLSKENTLWSKTVPLQSAADESAIFHWLKTPTYIFEGLPVWSVSHPCLQAASCVFFSFCHGKSLSIIYRAPFNNCISLTVNLLIRISAALVFLEISVIRKSKHPPGLSFTGSVFRAVHCLLQLAPKTWRLVAGLGFIVRWQTIPFGVATLQPHRDNGKDKPKKCLSSSLGE